MKVLSIVRKAELPTRTADPSLVRYFQANGIDPHDVDRDDFAELELDGQQYLCYREFRRDSHGSILRSPFTDGPWTVERLVPLRATLATIGWTPPAPPDAAAPQP